MGGSNYIGEVAKALENKLSTNLINEEDEEDEEDS